MIRGINHVTFSVSALERSFNFYRDVLGFKPLMRSAKSAYFLAGDLWFCIEEDASVRREALPEYTHVAFSVARDRFAQTANRIVESGARIFKENKSEGDSLYFLDPDGHKLELHAGSWRSRVEHAHCHPWGSPLEFFPVEDFSIERSRVADRDVLNALAFRSKCYWPYSLEYLTQCIPSLHLTDEDIEQWPVYMARDGEGILGFFALKTLKGEDRLDHLWVDPRFIGKGVGRLLFARAAEEAKGLGWKQFRLAADPFAEPFYLRRGAVRIGLVQSRIKPDLYLPHMEYRF